MSFRNNVLFREAARLSLVALLVVAGTGLASAQIVTVRGVVENQGATFVLGCTPLTLSSGVVNLNALLGQEVQAVGTVTSADHVTVASATPVTDVLELSGGAKIGGTLKLQVTGPAGRIEQIHVALGNGFAVTHGMGWFLDAGQQTLAQATIPALGKLELSFGIPNLAALEGVEVFFQDVRLSAGQPAKLGNADCVTLQS